ncbi:hypothetical protein E3N88_32385 [Mikania micrantha]|uniref:Retrovirus-related Pol polyprotein from transposon TNT 1-94-like beta-barrel domain-containing protein n=1 Tax=Mikania micrantha TaxID=192012 RepID=A0A5N6M8W4_9ASTR|nr:hypothetical protein E3N88_32385 [Mikania micrantha]
MQTNQKARRVKARSGEPVRGLVDRKSGSIQNRKTPVKEEDPVHSISGLMAVVKAAECRAPLKAEGEANLTREDDDQTLLMVSYDVVMLNEEKVFPDVYAKENSEAATWYLDNGASNHITGKREYFCELNEKTIGGVRFGDGSAVEIKGKGSILLQCKNGDQRLVTNVYYILELCDNILSLGQFDEGGCKIVINDGILWLFKRSGQR